MVHAIGVLATSAGQTGASIATPCMNPLQLKGYAAPEFAAGVAANGLETVRAFQVNEIAETFAGIAIGLNPVLTSLFLPFVLGWFLD